jgi:hypothetical protein
MGCIRPAKSADGSTGMKPVNTAKHGDVSIVARILKLIEQKTKHIMTRIESKSVRKHASAAMND